MAAKSAQFLTPEPVKQGQVMHVLCLLP